MDRVLVFGTSDGGSIPSRGTKLVNGHSSLVVGLTTILGSVAQLVEQLPLKELVVGSIPARLTLPFLIHMNQRKFFLVFLLVVVSFVLTAYLYNNSSQYISVKENNSTKTNWDLVVPLKIEELTSVSTNSGQLKTWLATYKSDNSEAHFYIDMILKQRKKDDVFVFTTGKIRSAKQTNYKPLREALAKVLNTNSIPQNVSITSELPIDVAILGYDQSKVVSEDGSVVAGEFSPDPPGNWIVTKVFVASGEGEFYLNLNPIEKKGEISMKDPEYGDIVLKELAKVLY
jgi:hypothetical protein